jgi:hypothetical protein
MVQALMSMEQLQEVSDLLCGADWALAHNDLGTLGALATKLATHVPVPLRKDLLAIAELLVRDPDSAILLWVQARRHVHAYLCDRAEGHRRLRPGIAPAADSARRQRSGSTG